MTTIIWLLHNIYNDHQMYITCDIYVFFDLRLNKRLNKQSRRWWFETPSRSLWRHMPRSICFKGLPKYHYLKRWYVDSLRIHFDLCLYSDAILLRSGSTLVQATTRCLTAPSHCLNQREFVTFTGEPFTANVYVTIQYSDFGNYISKTTLTSPIGTNELKRILSVVRLYLLSTGHVGIVKNTIEACRLSVDVPYTYQIFKWVAVTLNWWKNTRIVTSNIAASRCNLP